MIERPVSIPISEVATLVAPAIVSGEDTFAGVKCPFCNTALTLYKATDDGEIMTFKCNDKCEQMFALKKRDILDTQVISGEAYVRLMLINNFDGFIDSKRINEEVF